MLEYIWADMYNIYILSLVFTQHLRQVQLFVFTVKVHFSQIVHLQIMLELERLEIRVL